ncbi:molybdate ABC transporter substrate-binding protein [Desulfosporosinus sp. FKB]|uniref:molybdate ABC transporter substrate-binding protein n=1 Tax=Desulfosporosinus sp. FKB TaxID=1969835 RepID=UPI000B49BBDB|nr:molybdate ABC transporter substrate-binding protein [Desulfosporosinus sp. FKB]
MKKIVLLVSSLLLIFTLVGCGTGNTAQSSENTANTSQTQAKPTEIMIAAAASLKDSLTELQSDYAKVKPGVKLTFNFAASGTLQQQIEQGAPVDLFISAGKSQMDALEKKNLLLKDSRINLLGNDLVLVAGKDNSKITAVQDVAKADVSQVSIGTPESVPAGKYAQESLKNLKLWDAVQSKLVQAKDVTQVLNYVETGNADAGFVYRSDAQQSKKVKVVAVVPDNTHTPIVYPAAIIAATKNQQAAQDFFKYLQSADAQKVFQNYGFKTLAK